MDILDDRPTLNRMRRSGLRWPTYPRPYIPIVYYEARGGEEEETECQGCGEMTTTMASTAISSDRRTVHIVAEALALLTVAPFGVYIALRKNLPAWARVAGGVLAASAVLVDGGLLLTWPRRNGRS